ncbi:MAG: hypothetical protein GY847_01200, partial [Proteobacteria bacterium]|nr:hypothetical protein [Pseudomonadota bacterium]
CDALLSPCVGDRNTHQETNGPSQRGWSIARQIATKQKKCTREHECKTQCQVGLNEGDWVFENDPTVESRSKRGKLSPSYCGPYRLEELNYDTCMGRVAMKNGNPRWIPLKWLFRCDSTSLLRKKHDPWVGQYDKCSTLQLILESGDESPENLIAEQMENEVDEDAHSLSSKIAIERMKLDDDSTKYLDDPPTGDPVELESVDL